MATFLLVHAAWFGGWCWREITPLLRARGHAVFTPTLTGLGERCHLAHRQIGLETHIEDVVNVLIYEDLTQVILVGHSNGGTLITAVADRAPERLAHLVYLDAFVPEDGQATIDLVPSAMREGMEKRVREEGYGWLLPSLYPGSWDEALRDVWHIEDEGPRQWIAARLGPTPFKAHTDPVRRKNPSADRLPRTYIRCTQARGGSFDAWAARAKEAEGWRYRELPTSHLPFFTMPRETADLLLEIAS